MNAHQHDQHFSLREARDTLVEILPSLERIVELKRVLDAKGFDIAKHQYFGGMGPNGQKFFPDELEELVALARDIRDRGVVFKSVERGLIDFPHLRSNGEEVYLCFQVGEPEIEFWHDLASGFAGRRPISEL